jgi:hypothetical protein
VGMVDGIMESYSCTCKLYGERLHLLTGNRPLLESE